MAKKSKKAKQGKLQQKSPADFFHENKAIAGFDNPTKSLYTTVRELVENSLDAAEAIGVLPNIDVVVRQVLRAELDQRIGLTRREAPSGEGAEGGDDGPSQSSQASQQAGRRWYYEITVTDNGSGMAHESIPNMLGIVLSGTKYGVKQTRGKFGLGAKMALIWAKSSTGVPIEVYSAQEGSETISYYKLDIDIQRNRPNVVEEKKMVNAEAWRGTKLVVTIEGTWKYQKRVLEYMRMMAILTPYAWFRFAYEAERESSSFVVEYARRLNAELPPLASEVKHHPRSLNLILVNRLLADAPASMNVKKFLTSEFSSISSGLATKIADAAGVELTTKVKDLAPTFVHRLLQAFHNLPIPEPSGKCLSPAGEYNLFLGIKKEIRPTLVATYQDRAHAFEGHPFVVEAGVSIGGDSLTPGITVYRYANRIPLLFEPGNDVITITANKFKWANYKIRPTIDKIGVFVSIVSTHIPFKGTGKEYVGASKEIEASIRTALRHCCISLKKKIATRSENKTKVDKKRKLAKYIPDVSRAMHAMLVNIASDDRAAKRRKPLTGADAKLIAAVRDGDIDDAFLAARLTTHVDKIDAEGALQYVAETAAERRNTVPYRLAPVPVDSARSGVVLSKRGLVLTFNL